MPARSIDEWLLEWQRWVNAGRLGPDQPIAVSLESRYRSPQVWEANPPDLPPLRDYMGFAVERALLCLPQLERSVIRADYTLDRMPEENEEHLFERKRRYAQVPAWQFQVLKTSGKKYLAIVLKLE